MDRIQYAVNDDQVHYKVYDWSFFVAFPLY